MLSKQMPSQDSQGRKLLHIVSIVANLPITGVEGHCLKDPSSLYNVHSLRSLVQAILCAAPTDVTLPSGSLYLGAPHRILMSHGMLTMSTIGCYLRYAPAGPKWGLRGGNLQDSPRRSLFGHGAPQGPTVPSRCARFS